MNEEPLPWEANDNRLWEDEPAGRVYDLEERCARFGGSVIRMLKTVPQGPLTNRLIDQLVGCSTSIGANYAEAVRCDRFGVVGCSTSIGANYAEADDSVSVKDFRNRIGTCRKESRESRRFLRMLATASEPHAPECRNLYREARELNLIFSPIWRKTAPVPETEAATKQSPKHRIAASLS
jgi:four helix bundle protein